MGRRVIYGGGAPRTQQGILILNLVFPMSRVELGRGLQTEPVGLDLEVHLPRVVPLTLDKF